MARLNYFPTQELVHRSYADYTDLLDFGMRETILTVRGIIEDEYDYDDYEGTLYLDQDYLFSLNEKLV